MKKTTPENAFFNTMLICYLIVSFGMWSLNPEEWGADVRHLYLLVATLISFAAYAIQKSETKPE
jgi:hypothetical protein